MSFKYLIFYFYFFLRLTITEKRESYGWKSKNPVLWCCSFSPPVEVRRLWNRSSGVQSCEVGLPMVGNRLRFFGPVGTQSPQRFGPKPGWSRSQIQEQRSASASNQRGCYDIITRKGTIKLQWRRLLMRNAKPTPLMLNFP